MILSRRRALAGIPSALALAVAGRGAGAVVVPESTWRAEGLHPFISLAHQAQFAALVALSEDGGEGWNVASSTWIGNFGGVGYLLTAGHVYGGGATVDHYLYRTRSGQVRHGTRLLVHPLYNGDGDTRGGYDAALVRLDGPVNDAGPPPLLFAHELEGGERITFVGFGSRGTGARGEHEDFDTPADNKTAAEATVDEVMDPIEPTVDDEEAGTSSASTSRAPAIRPTASTPSLPRSPACSPGSVTCSRGCASSADDGYRARHATLSESGCIGSPHANCLQRAGPAAAARG
jgi:hypothetical protein